MIEVVENDDPPRLKKINFSCDTSIGDDIKHPFPRGAFSMLLTAKPASGKTTFLSNMLVSKDLYRHRYDHVYLFMPANSYQSIPESSLIRKHDKVFHQLDAATLQTVVKNCEAASAEKENSLVVIDDFLGSLKDQNILKMLVNMFANRRHLRCSTIIATQVYKSLPLVLRKELSHVVVWKLSNKKETKSIKEEMFSGMTEEEADQIINHCHKDSHSFVLIDAANGRYYDSMFDEIKIV